ncbi:beta-defensin 133-like [Manis pentadactyla]|uniref:beta-defensin 133-like n=1 Tax=Manis pentadactyla TaxID=143292 RepID=UPI00255C5F0F|nr:beta-defensin 133-like [Manis pentadactyla]
MKIPVLLFVLFFFLAPLPPSKREVSAESAGEKETELPRVVYVGPRRESQKGLVTLIKGKAPVKCAMKDAYGCFIQRGKCRRECHDSEKRVDFCTRLNANCCM